MKFRKIRSTMQPTIIYISKGMRWTPPVMHFNSRQHWKISQIQTPQRVKKSVVSRVHSLACTPCVRTNFFSYYIGFTMLEKAPGLLMEQVSRVLQEPLLEDFLEEVQG